MRAYALTGQRAEAFATYDEIVIQLDQELSARPGAALRALRAQIAADDMHGRSPVVQPGPPISTISSPSTEPAFSPPIDRADWIPPQFSYTTLFFGREQEMKQIYTLINRGERRLITLTGPGGIGKTRLAVALGREVQSEQERRVVFVSLADCHSPTLLIDAIRDALGIAAIAATDQLDLIVVTLRARPTLLILDNFEQLVAECSPLVDLLIRRAPSLICLITSRRSLSIAGEREYEIPPLLSDADGALLDEITAIAPETLATNASLLDRLLRIPSLQLFVDRARDRVADFGVTWRNAHDLAKLCRMLEGIPLAIEITAARSRVLGPRQMTSALGERRQLLELRNADLHPRQQSLRAAIAWSYDLLLPPVQHLFANLSVFRGSWSAEAVIAICGDSHTFEYLTMLRTHSLIFSKSNTSEPRFYMLETLREFARRQRPPNGDELEARHLQYYAHRVTTIMQQSDEPNHTWIMREIVPDLDNVRAALAWSLKHPGAVQAGLRLAVAMYTVWEIRGALREGCEWIEQLLEAAPTAEVEVRSAALRTAGALARSQGQYGRALDRLDASLRLAEAIGDQKASALALRVMGHVYHDQGEYERAEAAYRRAYDIFVALGDETSSAATIGSFGVVAEARGDLHTAAAHYKHARELLREGRAPRDLAGISLNLANIARENGDIATAGALLDESGNLYAQLDDLWSQAYVTLNRGTLAEARNDLPAALVCYTTAWQQCMNVGDRWAAAHARNGMGRVALGQGDFGAAMRYYREALDIREALMDREGIARSIESIAELAARRAQWPAAVQLWAMAQAVIERLGAITPPALERSARERCLAEARLALGATQVEMLWHHGRAQSVDDALALARRLLA